MTREWIHRDSLADARALLARLADDATLVDPERDVHRVAVVVGRRARDTRRATRQCAIVAAVALAVAGAAYLAIGLPGRAVAVQSSLLIAAATGLAAAVGAVGSRLKARERVSGQIALIVERDDDWPDWHTVGRNAKVINGLTAERVALHEPYLLVESRDGRRRKIRVFFETWETLRPGDVVTLSQHGSEVVRIRLVASVDPARNPLPASHAHPAISR